MDIGLGDRVGQDDGGSDGNGKVRIAIHSQPSDSTRIHPPRLILHISKHKRQQANQHQPAVHVRTHKICRGRAGFRVMN